MIAEIIQDIIYYKKYNNKELSQIAKFLLNIVKYYYNLKFKININNCWFKFSKKYDDWIFYDFRRLNDISEAKMNKSDVSFKKIKNYNWFENDILRIIEKIITELINKKDYEELINILEVFENFFNHNLDYTFSINFIILLQNILNNIKYENSAQIVNVVDIIGLIYVKFIKSFMEKISYYNLNSFNSYASVDWYDFNDILNYDVPIESFNLIKTIPDYLDMEISIEDEIITNNHFITECIFKSYYFATENSITLIIDTDEYFQELIINIINNNNGKDYNIYHILLPLIFRLIESNEQMDLYLIVNNLEEINSEIINYIEFDSINYDFHIQKHVKNKNRLYSLLIEFINNIPSKMLLSDDFSNYIGRTFTYLLENCIDILENKENPLLFKENFQGILNIWIKLEEYIISKENITLNDRLKLIQENIYKIIDVGSYAFLYSELYEIDYTTVVFDTIELYREKENISKQKFIQKLIKIYSNRLSFGISAQDIERGELEQRFNYNLNKKYNLISQNFKNKSKYIKSKILDYYINEFHRPPIHNFIIAKYIYENNLDVSKNDYEIYNIIKIIEEDDEK